MVVQCTCVNVCLNNSILEVFNISDLIFYVADDKKNLICSISSDRPESEFRFRFVPIPTFFGRSANSEFRFRSPCHEVSAPISDSDYKFNLNSNGIGTTSGSSDEIGIGTEKC